LFWQVKKMAKRKAFTLAELIIVVLIIGVMAIIAIPRLGFSLISGGKAQATAQTLAAAIRYTRSLAITNAATFELDMLGSPYSSFRILNPQTGDVNQTGSITEGVSCTGDSQFLFSHYGNRTSGTGGLTVSAGGKTYVITVVSSTGMVKCELQ
jgi:prepilin-type N-terminal cleavage/methylation domain-containing protein